MHTIAHGRVRKPAVPTRAIGAGNRLDQEVDYNIIIIYEKPVF